MPEEIIDAEYAIQFRGTQAQINQKIAALAGRATHDPPEGETLLQRANARVRFLIDQDEARWLHRLAKQGIDLDDRAETRDPQAEAEE
ncbi:hypothetical protein Pan216_30190 [Planctomycetes bacterium Pan216]|uniref:Uncharacterized protein n=1 Tax=Kolteria novifilia TaxID=2527975 RepID=A0A518B5C4_9BACT|nr:hypothetical protein Pan216_30190 [Planctomycetes bacterium Pan216]